MAEETQPKASEAAPASEVVVVETAAAEPTAEKPAKEEAAPADEAAGEEEKKAEEVTAAAVAQSVSFKEESNVVGDLTEAEKKALDELKQLVRDALANNEFAPPPPPPPPAAPAPAAAPAAEEQPPAAPAEEEAKPEEPAAPASSEEPTKPAEEAAERPKPEAVEEEKKEPGEPAKPAAVEEEKKPAEPEPEPEPAKEAAPPAEEKAVVVDEDGAKTVEAIEETVVSVSAAPPAPSAEEVTPIAAEPEKPAEGEAPAPAPAEPEEVSIWGVPLLADEQSDTVLIKFLRARDFKVKEAFAMLKSAVIWRKVFGIEALLEEDLGLSEMDKVVFMHGVGKEGHPVCYNVYGEFQSKELYEKAFGDEQKRQTFLKWRIQCLEKGIREQLDFTPGKVCSMVQVTDLKNAPRLGKHRQAMKQAVTLLQDNYPEFTAKNIFINVPWWYLAFNRMMSTIYTPRTKSKMVFAGPSKSAETLFKYIAPEQVPVQYGGLNREDPDFSTSDPVTEVTIKPLSQEIIEIPVTETCLLVWEVRVLGWEVSYGSEFTPSAEGAYTVIIQKPRKMPAMEEPILKTSFKVGEPGKVVLTFDNPTSKKKKLLYRTKVKSSTEST